MSYILDTTLALGSTGSGYADLRAQLYDTSGVNYGSDVSTGFSEIGGGYYNWHYAAFPDSFRGGVKFYRNSASSTILACASINPQEVENANVLTSSISSSGSDGTLYQQVPASYPQGTAGFALGRIGSGFVSTSYPVYSTNEVVLVKGSDYLAADGQALDWTDTMQSWPDLTSGSVVFAGTKTTRDYSFNVAGSVVTATGTNKKVRAEPTSTDTGALVIGDYRYNVYVNLPNGHKVTLIADSPLKAVQNYPIV